MVPSLARHSFADAALKLWPLQAFWPFQAFSVVLQSALPLQSCRP